MRLRIQLILLLLLFIFYLPFQGAGFSYNENVRVIHETDKNVFNSYKDEEILIILDYSSSMLKKLNGKSRGTQAMYGVLNLLDTVPDSAKIGIRIFGPDERSMREVPNGINTYGDCTASTLAVPIAKNNVKRIKNKLRDYTRPFGESPIAYSLTKAIKNDFSSNNKNKHIILITDGDEGCGGDPCGYINSLVRNRKDILIDVVFITDENKTINNLECLSTLTNGKFYRVHDYNDFALKLKTTLVYFDEQEKQKGKDSVNNELTTEFNQPKQKNYNQTKYSNYFFEFDM